MSSSHANRYTPEFKQRAVQPCESRIPVTYAEVARELGVDAGTLSKWVAQARPGEYVWRHDNEGPRSTLNYMSPVEFRSAGLSL
jgi:transposase-like protein